MRLDPVGASRAVRPQTTDGGSSVRPTIDYLNAPEPPAAAGQRVSWLIIKGRFLVHYVGNAAPTTSQQPELEGPTFLYSDPQSEELLYARASWGLPAAPEIPPLAPAIAPTEKPSTDSESSRLALLWEAAWASVWAVYGHADRGDSIPGLAMPVPQLLDRRFQIAPTTLSPNRYADWAARVVRPTPLGTQYVDIAIAAHAAVRRGLSSVHVLPVAGLWHARMGDNLMLISTGLHDDLAALATALEKF
jgi:hypothetical protein